MIGRIYIISSPEVKDVCYIGSTLKSISHRWKIHQNMYQLWCQGLTNALTIYPYFQEHGIDKFTMTLVKEYPVVDIYHLRAYEQLWINKYRKTAVNKRTACQLIPIKILNKIKIQTQKKTNLEAYKQQYKNKYQKAKQDPQFMERRRQYAKEYAASHREKCRQNAKEYIATHKEKYRQYAKEYAATHKEQIKEYYQANKEKYKASNKKRYQSNKEYHTAYVKEYYQANKEKILSEAKQKIQCGCGSKYQRAGKTQHIRTKKHIQWMANSTQN